MKQLVLASTSPSRRELLQRLHYPFVTVAPLADETPLPAESPEQLVQRLAEAKALSVRQQFPDALIIGCDQVAVVGETILGKPGDHQRAVAQLQRLSGQLVRFVNGLVLYNAATGRCHKDVIVFAVTFRTLDAARIERYLHQEQPYHCAGSFKSEQLGIALCEAFHGEDPTALVGLPLIRLVTWLELEGVVVP
ncbi:MAG: septum formation inhibitor Maf [Magnetococcales bacterium]|nr:septum formation inhibitor Maf [Magnetococcales bacterium]